MYCLPVLALLSTNAPLVQPAIGSCYCAQYTWSVLTTQVAYQYSRRAQYSFVLYTDLFWPAFLKIFLSTDVTYTPLKICFIQSWPIASTCKDAIQGCYTMLDHHNHQRQSCASEGERESFYYFVLAVCAREPKIHAREPNVEHLET
jgi:hypothetical protein